jgi:hypothetical protein
MQPAGGKIVAAGRPSAGAPRQNVAEVDLVFELETQCLRASWRFSSWRSRPSPAQHSITIRLATGMPTLLLPAISSAAHVLRGLPMHHVPSRPFGKPCYRCRSFLNLVGDAHRMGPTLALTTDNKNSRGAVWYAGPPLTFGSNGHQPDSCLPTLHHVHSQAQVSQAAKRCRWVPDQLYGGTV